MKLKEYPFYFVWSLVGGYTYFRNAFTSIMSCMRYHGNDVGYVLVITKDLTQEQKDLIKKVEDIYGNKITVKKFANLSSFRKYSRYWHPIVFAKLFYGDSFDVPYATIDADVMFLDRIKDFSFIQPNKIYATPDTVLLRKKRNIILSEKTNTKLDKYICAGVMFTTPNTINGKEVMRYVIENKGDLLYNEQDAINILYQDKIEYLPENIGFTLSARSVKRLEYQSKCNNNDCCFVHTTTKQWEPKSFLYNDYLSYIRILDYYD